MKTQEEFMEKSHINESLIEAVVDQLGGWETFKECAEDITNHGINGGFGGFIYYADTESFTEDNKSLIIDNLKEMADSLGESYFGIVSNFNCLDLDVFEVAEGLYGPESEDRTQVFNALAWYAGEEVARSYSDLVYEETH